jgi:hypothetical protein
MPVSPVNLTIKLGPSRRRFAKSQLRLFQIILTSDGKLYNSGKAFLPIFPIDDPALNDAIALIEDRLRTVLTPGG